MTAPHTSTYPWYTKVPAIEQLEQGDFVLKCQVIVPDSEAYAEGQTIKAAVIEYDVVVMSQSCDLVGDKIDLVLVCPFYTLKEYSESFSVFKTASEKENLRKGQRVGVHLLNKRDPSDVDDYLVVDFKSIYAVPIKMLKQMVLERGQRDRLLPPYREHLSQAFARFFMRVGLPVDIPSFT